MATTTYSTGTISVGAGSTAVTGVGTAWATIGIQPGDMLMAAGLVVRIAAVNSNTSITLARAWPGAALSGAVYDIDYRDEGVRAWSAANAVLELADGTLSALAATGPDSAANKLPYYSGNRAFALADMSPAARAMLALTGAGGAKIPVISGTATAALRDIVGTVAQAGGIPTGAVMQPGAGATGAFDRLADGWQVCWASVLVTRVGVTSLRASWVYPAPFVAAPMVLVSPQYSTATGYGDAAGSRHQFGSAGATSISALNVLLDVYKSYGAPDIPEGAAMTVSACAIGRWY